MPNFEPQPTNSNALEPGSQNLTDQFFSPEAAKYKNAFPRIIHAFNQLPHAVGQVVEKEEGGIKFRVSTPKLRTGKHAKVGLVEIIDNGSVFECALRSDPSDAREYLDHIRDNPAIAEFVPKLYAIVNDWAVLERLHGLELAEVEEKMRTDPQFLEKFATHAFDIIYRAAQKKIQLNDMMFMDGHNFLVDENTGEVRFIEHRNAYPYPFLDTNELIARQLFTEAYQITHSSKGREPFKVAFVRKLFQRAGQVMGLQNLYVRTRVVLPTHSRYKEAWFIANWETLPEEKHQMILNNSTLRDSWTVNWFGRGFTEAITPELVEAISSGDENKIDAVLLEQKYKYDITDKSDPRSKSVILRDDQPK